ncbi:MAG: hypothetical protein WAT66_12495 [Actinomycetota bacterium]|jgi:Na+-translocating ferredoxin:NAD+ oxidoreductase RnfG subunit
MREEYVSPVGFAKEPSEERRRWIGRIFLIALVLFIGWLLVNRVINPPAETPQIGNQIEETTIPASD